MDGLGGPHAHAYAHEALAAAPRLGCLAAAADTWHLEGVVLWARMAAAACSCSGRSALRTCCIARTRVPAPGDIEVKPSASMLRTGPEGVPALGRQARLHVCPYRWFARAHGMAGLWGHACSLRCG